MMRGHTKVSIEAVTRMRDGMTLIEMLLALLIFTVAMIGAVDLMRTQFNAFTVGTEKANRVQNFRFAANILEKDLRTVGFGVPGIQPFLVYAGEDVIAFNANYVSNMKGSFDAVYVDTLMPASATEALRKTQRMLIPRTSVYYPDTTYLVSGVNSSAETIFFYFELDTEDPRDSTFVLYRKINNEDPEVVSRNLRRAPGRPFFEYLRPATSGGGSGLEAIPAAQIPLRHPIPMHQSAADTGVDARIDEIRAVRVNFLASSPDARADGGTSVISRLIHMPNAGMAKVAFCGSAPIMDGLFTVERKFDSDTETYSVELAWNPSIDEESGERDVLRYVIWRRPYGENEWDEPIVSIAAGLAEGVALYTITDYEVVPGEVYEYAVAAQDCTPSLSSLLISDPIEIPLVP